MPRLLRKWSRAHAFLGILLAKPFSEPQQSQKHQRSSPRYTAAIDISYRNSLIVLQKSSRTRAATTHHGRTLAGKKHLGHPIFRHISPLIRGIWGDVAPRSSLAGCGQMAWRRETQRYAGRDSRTTQLKVLPTALLCIMSCIPVGDNWTLDAV